MVNLRSIFELLIKEVESQSVRDVYKLKLISVTSPYIFAGIDTANLNRQLFIDLGQETWEEEQMRSLPKWRGLTIKVDYMKQLGPLKNRYLLSIRQESEESHEIFESILQNVVDHIMLMEKNKTLFGVVYKVFDRWKTFFSKGGYRKLTEEQQRGLYGELFFLKKWIDRFPTQPALIIKQWEGPTSGRIDFVTSKYGIEIKTCSEKLRKEIKISNEKQLKLSDVLSTLYLYVCYLEPNYIHGHSLQNIVDDIRQTLEIQKSEGLLLHFNDLLMELGFKDGEYDDTLFFVHEEETYHVTKDFPKLSNDILPRGISHVSYYIDLEHCEEFKCSLDTLFNS
ncbi:hypothetical protein B9C88_14475 [Brevibacillus laterosporus]|uniref:PD-(D/E)XK motif protein n=1 Tax=Brevibacillus laterosporus TaxID=1465 RepID=UPI000BDB0F66|nr:PD-(D/E)XK motif protein [Brevibacillus laterosporus]PCN43647.1 hypothetical protein B9C88_14475 [Brevibacillus laterosporus]